jgi:hypothetical protein
MATFDYMVPTVENAQHEPHAPWSLIAPTFPLVVQSIAATPATGKSEEAAVIPLGAGGKLFIKYFSILK